MAVKQLKPRDEVLRIAQAEVLCLLLTRSNPYTINILGYGKEENQRQSGREREEEREACLVSRQSMRHKPIGTRRERERERERIREPASARETRKL